ncbi:MAG: acyl-CoA dehydrogenase [Deltaproteobacteria bacterium]|nr:acyl-CoA dehydrogenase [Deltaproteobacteria bacterium]
MDFEWTAEENAAREQVAGLLDAGERGRLAALEEADGPALCEATLRGFRRLGGAGYWDAALGPRDDARTPLRAAMDLELARASSSFFLAVQATRHAAGLLAGWGPDDVRARLLGPLCAGEAVGAVVLPEAGAAADGGPAATDSGGGSWTLRGRRPFVANGPIADAVAVFAQTEDRTLVAFVRPGDAGVRLGPRLRTLGLDGLATSALELDGARVPADRVLGPFEDDAARVWCARSRDLGLAIAGVGLMQRALGAAKDHAQSHARGGKPLVARQEVGFKLAELLTLTQTAELLVHRAAWMVGAGEAEAGILVRCAKVFCAESAEKVAGGAMQVLAGHGCLAGHEVERAWREAKTLALMGTTVERSRMAIADELLARP